MYCVTVVEKDHLSRRNCATHYII